MNKTDNIEQINLEVGRIELVLKGIQARLSRSDVPLNEIANQLSHVKNLAAHAASLAALSDFN